MMITNMTLTGRLVGVLKLDAQAYEDIEHDRKATAQALTVVILGSLAAGLGAGLTFGATALVRETVGGVAGPLLRSRLEIDGKALSLCLANADRPLYGESVERRHRTLAAAFEREAVLEA